MYPPDRTVVFSLSLRVRSGLMTSQLCPSSVDRNTTSAAVYSTSGSCGDRTMGKVK